MHSISAAAAAFRTIIKFKRRAKPFDFRCVVVGDPRSGKTSFVEWLVFRANNSLYIPTILESYSARGTADITTSVCHITWKKYTVQFIDTSGTSQACNQAKSSVVTHQSVAQDATSTHRCERLPTRR